MSDTPDGIPGPSCSPAMGLFGRVRSLPSSTQPGRLTSLRTRDLTLGGALKKTKKTFEPNVHAARKNKDESKEEIHVAPKRERKERSERRRERRKERPRVIQSHSIFEQGPADSQRRPGWHGAARLHESPAVCRQLKKEAKQSAEDEDSLLRKLQRDDFIDDPGLKNDDNLKPIQLPLRMSSDVPAMSKAEPASLVELLQDLRLSGGEELFFMQLPDCMPGRASALKPAAESTSGKPTRKDGKPDGGTSAHESVVLSQFPEGLLGKLLIRKSGKMQLKMGDIVMDVSEGAAFSFLQQLVSVRLSEGQTGNMMVLGNVRHKLVLSPDFQVLLGQASVMDS